MSNWIELTRSYSVWDDKNIKGFFGEYRWLSNFWLSRIDFCGFVFPSSENAFQAAKTKRHEWYKFETCTAAQSKKLWKSCDKVDFSPSEWDEYKTGIMYSILVSKFSNPELKDKLVATGTKYLEETNHWGDEFWGINSKTGQGKNMLGGILMRIRDSIK